MQRLPCSFIIQRMTYFASTIVTTYRDGVQEGQGKRRRIKENSLGKVDSLTVSVVKLARWRILYQWEVYAK